MNSRRGGVGVGGGRGYGLVIAFNACYNANEFDSQEPQKRALYLGEQVEAHTDH
jgi:hypothetical protein